ncbi:MAG: 3-hydroxyacyl-CoA dehydrogenase NAD-binding domain-containing protein [Immundisolibacterales bacterium]|nr:3-hydroxyacyl-CoA dehydrogenase NAD-binding domain-containing protein [Immundisolibacterales bacterium]
MAVPASLDTVAVVGNGLIGHGMAQIFAAAGREVVLIGRREESLAGAMERIGASLSSFAAHGLLDSAEVAAAFARIRTSTDLGDAAAAQLVLEAVPADQAVQDEVYGALDRICAPPTVFASGSGQPASDLVANVRHRGRVIAAHFWYPPQLIPLVEVCAGPETDPDVAPWLCEVLRAAGKEPVTVDKEIPGFLGNRLQYAILREAWALWSEGAASAEAIDTVVKASIGRRLAITGPIESADVGGLDTLHAFGAYLIPHLRNDPQPARAVTDLVEAGHRGLPSGRGVYDGSRRDGERLLAEREAELFRHLARDDAKRG